MFILSRFQRLETGLLSLFTTFAFSISGIVVWLEELSSSCFTAILANDVLQIRLL